MPRMISSPLLRGRALVEARRRGLSASACSALDGSDESANISPTRTTLALSAYFCQPELGMKDFEILSRASAFLLSVDPKEVSDGEKPSTLFPHLQERFDTDERRKTKQEYRYDPATGPRRFPHQLNWLEFLPTAFRPRVHVVASSHVVSPFLWPKYYGHEWLQSVKQEHVKYSLEVWGPSEHKNSDEIENSHSGKLSGEFSVKAKFALNPYPIHHPSEMDIAIIHLNQEEAALKHMESLGIKALHLPTMHELNTSDEPVFTPGEKTLFQGFEVYEANPTDQESLSQNTSQTADDERVFHPYSSLGTLSMCSPDRFLARTDQPLPEGLCGGPAIELPTDGENVTIRGVIEGIVPIDHENKELAGSASFMPAYRIREFIDHAERFMIASLLDDDVLLQKIVDLKLQRESDAQTYDEQDLGDAAQEDLAALEGAGEDPNTPQLDEQYQNLLAEMYKNYSREDVSAMLSIVEREREQVMKMMEDGNGMDEAIAHVRRQTIQDRDQLLNEIEQKLANDETIPEGEYKDK